MSSEKAPPQTFGEARTRGYSLIDLVDAHSIPAAERNSVVHVRNAKAGDVAWHGPCVGGKMIVVYYDDNLDPSNSVTVDCKHE